MNVKLASLISLALVGLTGCAAGPGVVRGQAPSTEAGMQQAPPQIASPSGGSCPTCQMGRYSGVPAAVPNYNVRSETPLSHLFNHGHHGEDGTGHWHHPTHYHWFSYREPTNLVYPPRHAPAAVVQYPYYTLKGPTDFFVP